MATNLANLGWQTTLMGMAIGSAFLFNAGCAQVSGTTPKVTTEQNQSAEKSQTDKELTMASNSKDEIPESENRESTESSSRQRDYNPLTPEEQQVILHKGTEFAFTGEYTDLADAGTYVCRRCNAPLYSSKDKFDSHCGWPSFDDEIPGAVKKVPERDGTLRTEIICKNCGGHLGHVFIGEMKTEKNTRHCVNSLSMKFYREGKPLPPVVTKEK